MGPKGHAVLAWAARKTLVVKEIEVVRSHESLKKRGTGGRVPPPKSNRLRGERMLSARPLSKLRGMSKGSSKGHKVQELYPMILHAPDLWEHAYGHLYANKGGMPPGGDGQTLEGHADARAENLRQLLRDNRSVPTPAQRVSNPQPNGQLRPLRVPTANDT